MGSQAEQTSFLFAHNAAFIADLHARFKQDPGSVGPSWAAFFGTLGPDARDALDEVAGPSWARKTGPSVDLDGYGDALMAEAPPPAKPDRPAKPHGAAVEAASGAALGRATPDTIQARTGGGRVGKGGGQNCQNRRA